MTLVCCQLSLWSEYTLIFVSPGTMSHSGEEDKREEGRQQASPVSGSWEPGNQRARDWKERIKISKKTDHFILQLKQAKMWFMALPGMFRNSKLHSPWNVWKGAWGKCIPPPLGPAMGAIRFLASALGAQLEKLLSCSRLWIWPLLTFM